MLDKHPTAYIHLYLQFTFIASVRHFSNSVEQESLRVNHHKAAKKYTAVFLSMMPVA